MTLLGNTKRSDPQFKKKCLDAWLKYGSVEKAGNELGISPTTVRYHAWRYLLFHLDVARNLLNAESETDERYDKKPLPDEQFFRILASKGVSYLPAKKFRDWIESNKLYRYPSVLETYKLKYPTWYEDHRLRAIGEEVEGIS